MHRLEDKGEYLIPCLLLCGRQHTNKLCRIIKTSVRSPVTWQAVASWYIMWRVVNACWVIWERERNFINKLLSVVVPVTDLTGNNQAATRSIQNSALHQTAWEVLGWQPRSVCPHPSEARSCTHCNEKKKKILQWQSITVFYTPLF